MSKSLLKAYYALASQEIAYNATTGEFSWRRNGQGRPRSLKAGYDRPNEGRVIRIGGVEHSRQILGHNLAFFIKTGELPAEGKRVVHKNNDRCDNRWSNLIVIDDPKHFFCSLRELCMSQKQEQMCTKCLDYKNHLNLNLGLYSREIVNPTFFNCENDFCKIPLSTEFNSKDSAKRSF